MNENQNQLDSFLSKARSYAKPSCRKCLGRGYRLIQPAPIHYARYGQPTTNYDYCDCVLNRYSKLSAK